MGFLLLVFTIFTFVCVLVRTKYFKSRRRAVLVLGSIWALMWIWNGIGVSPGSGDRSDEAVASEQASAALETEEVSEPAPTPEPSVTTASVLDTERAFRAFCGLWNMDPTLEEQAVVKFGAGNDEATRTKRFEWVKQRDEELALELEQDLGVDFWDIQQRADEENWYALCDSVDTGLRPITVAQAEASTGDDVSRARIALELHYLQKLDEGGTSFFDPDVYGGVRCRPAEEAGLTFIGCKLISFSAETDPDVHMIAHSNGETVIVPFDGEAKRHTEDRHALSDDDGHSLPLGTFVGPSTLVDYAAVRSHFE